MAEVKRPSNGRQVINILSIAITAKGCDNIVFLQDKLSFNCKYPFGTEKRRDAGQL